MPRPWPTTPPTAEERAAYAEALPRSYWLDALPAREPAPALEQDEATELCIIGGGFSGLWAALLAKADRPGRDVVLLEGDRIGGAASGRNGGFCVASVTHGLANGRARFPDELAALERLGLANHAALVDDLATYGIDCDWEATGELTVALEDHQVEWLAEEAEPLRAHGHDVVLLDEAAMQAAVASPTYRGGLWDRTGAGVLDPGKLTDGLRRAALAAGVRIFEHTRATNVTRVRDQLRVLAIGDGRHACQVQTKRALLLTGAHPPLVRSARRRVAPVYDYVLMTEPLSAAQLASIGWSARQGIGDCANQFHYYRLTADDRILWGGYDAVWERGGAVRDGRDQHDASFARLSQHFFTTFPQLRGLRFTHRWGGAIDTCSRFSVFFGTSHGGAVAHAAGYTGLGVGASRFGAQVALELVDGQTTERTALDYVRSAPRPFPPEPLRTASIRFTQNRLEAADAAGGRRGLWLRMLDRAGLGFDS